MSSSNSSHSSGISKNASETNCLDPLDSLLDFSEYESMNYNSPSISPCESTKSAFVRPVPSTPTANTLLPPSQQTLSGPSHPYDLHKQQTGLPTGGLATTLAINNNSQMYAGYGYLSGVNSSDDFVDLKFDNGPSSGSFDGITMDLDYDAPTVDPAFFFPPMPSSAPDYVRPSNISGHESHTVPSNAAINTQSSNVGRLWPGMHQQQAAMAKAQQQQKQQRHLIHQRRQNSAPHPQQPLPQSKPKSRPATDPIVEEKISQLLNSMRQNSVATSNGDDDASTPNGNMSHAHRSRKDEEDMDEDERLLASEEGKKLSSKERRQLRNKVSARAFRSRRKGM